MGDVVDHPARAIAPAQRLVSEWCDARRRLGWIHDPRRCHDGGVMPPGVEAAYRELG
jgi:hypothetical protein